jgi:hypothetical protein
MTPRSIILPRKVRDWSGKPGEFVSLGDVQTVIRDEPVDIYKPQAAQAELFGWDKSDFLLLSYRPRAFDTTRWREAGNAIRSGTAQHGNSIRGTAGGLKKTGDALERCIYDGELRLLQELQKTSWMRTAFDFTTGSTRATVDIIADEYPQWAVSHTGRPWRDHHNRPSREEFLRICREFGDMPNDTRIPAVSEFFAARLYKVSNFGNFNENGVGGAVPRSAAYPYCRQSIWNGKNPELLGEITEFSRMLDGFFADTTPAAHRRQHDFIRDVHPDWRLADTAYTTLTFNRNFRTAAHYDNGDFRSGFGNLSVFRSGSYEGAVTVFPEWGVGVDMQDGDWMAMDVHELHGNTAFYNTSDDYERLSMVAYCREDIADCDPPEDEALRVEFLKQYKTPDRKTGIWGGMWLSPEWEAFKKERSK